MHLKQYHLKQCHLNGEMVTICYQLPANGSLIKVQMESQISDKVLDSLRKIMCWTNMPSERLLAHIREGLWITATQFEFLAALV